MNLAVHPNVLMAIGGVFAILVVSTIVVQTLRRVRPGLDLEEVRKRVTSWWVMAGVFTLAMVFNRNVSLFFFAFLSFLAFKEYLSVIPTRRADRRVLFWAYLAIPFQYLWVGMDWYGMFIIWIPVYAFLFLPMRMVLVGETAGFLRSAGTVHWGLMTTAFMISHVAYVLVLAPEHNPAGGGPALVLYLVVLTQLNDVAQYLWGKGLGRTPVAPKVSPKKTLEGFLGGLLSTVVIALVIAPWLTPFDEGAAALTGLIIGLTGFIGDVVVSALKRDLGIKDSGALIPGHGGVLDRLDSLMYTAPLFFHYFVYVHIR